MASLLPKSKVAAPIHEEAKDRWFYHGTSSERRAEAILHYGIQPREISMPDRAKSREGLAPAPGRVYLTTNIGYAGIYALGGDMFGHEIGEKWLTGRDGEVSPYGYIFGVSGANIPGDVVPDEDSVGEFISEVLSLVRHKRELERFRSLPKPPSEDFIRNKERMVEESEQEPINRPEAASVRSHLMSIADRVMTDRQREKVEMFFIDGQAAVGKKVQKQLAPFAIKWMLDNGAHTAHRGAIFPAKAWRFLKTDAAKVAAGDVLSICEEIPVMQSKVAKSDDATLYESHIEAHDSAALDILREYQQHLDDPNYRQQWDLIPAARLVKIWNDYVKLGFVRDERGIDRIADIIIENIAKLEVNTILCGHAAYYDPLEYAKGVLGDGLPDDFLERENSFFEDEKGAWRISDYAMKKLSDQAIKLRGATSPEQKLQIIDHILNIIHLRSDLSSWFVEGGRKTLNQLAGTGKAAAASKPLYHVTFLNRLNDIAEEGLVPGSRRSIGGPALDGHAAAKVFLTTADGVSFWLNRAEMFAYHEADNPVREGYIPIVLRVKVPTKGLITDAVGSDDAGAEAFHTSNPIDPGKIEHWNGTKWSGVKGLIVMEEDYESIYKRYGGAEDEGYLNSNSPLNHPNLAAGGKTADGPTQDQDQMGKPDDITEAPAFQSWFKGSKVVDDHRRPLRVYHGTNADFDTFDPEKGERSSEKAMDNIPGVSWFAANPDAGTYFGGWRDGARVMPVYLSIKNPLTVDLANMPEVRGEFFNIGKRTVYDIRYIKGRSIQQAKDDGNDGVIFLNGYDGTPASGTIFAVFSANQIKSSIGNNGKFDPKSNSITASHEWKLYRGAESEDTEFHSGQAVWLAFAPEYAEKYGRVLEYTLKSGTKILDARTPEGGEVLKRIDAKLTDGSDHKIWLNAHDGGLPSYKSAYWVRSEAKPMGYDGAVFTEHSPGLGGLGIHSVCVWNTDKLKRIGKTATDKLGVNYTNLSNKLTLPTFREFMRGTNVDRVVNLSEDGDMWAEHVEALDPNFRSLPSDEQDRAMREYAEHDAKERYDSLCDQFEAFTFPLTVFRGVHLVGGMPSLDMENVGESWSYEERSAELFLSGTQDVFILKAQVPLTSIDWEETLLLNLDTGLGHEENEIRVRFDAPIKLVAYRPKKGREWAEFRKPVFAARKTVPTAILDDPKFKAWFAGSKIVDKDGSPLLVYHGSDERIKDFKWGRTIHFTDSSGVASSYAQGHYGGHPGYLYAAYLKITDPIDLRNPDETRRVFDETGQYVDSELVLEPERLFEEFDIDDTNYDGIINSHERGGGARDGSNEYIVFNPDQIWRVETIPVGFDKDAAADQWTIEEEHTTDIDGQDRYRLKLVLDGVEIGHLGAIVKSDHVKVDDVFVNPEFRNRGYGVQLYRKAEEIALAHHVPEIRSAYSVSPDAQRVWKSIGGEPFDEHGTQRWRLKVTASYPPMQGDRLRQGLMEVYDHLEHYQAIGNEHQIYQEVKEFLGAEGMQTRLLSRDPSFNVPFPSARYAIRADTITIDVCPALLTGLSRAEWAKAMNGLVSKVDHEETHRVQQKRRRENNPEGWEKEQVPYELTYNADGMISDESLDGYLLHPMEVAAFGREIVSELRSSGWSTWRIKVALRDAKELRKASEYSPVLRRMFARGIDSKPYFKSILQAAWKAIALQATPERGSKAAALSSTPSESDIEYWTGYTRSLDFKTAEEARKWLFDYLERLDQSQGGLFGARGTDGNRAYSEAMPVYRDRRKFKLGQKPKAPPVSKERLGTEEPDGSSPSVDWYARDNQDTGRVSEASLLRDYSDGKPAMVYQSWIDTNDMPEPILAEESDPEFEEEGSGYDWDSLRMTDNHRRLVPPMKVRVTPKGLVQIMDGNHRLTLWQERGYSCFPAWVIDQRKGVKLAAAANPILVVVHPGSACGSADFNLGRFDARAGREGLIREFQNWNGGVIVLSGALDDELPSYPNYNKALNDVLDRAKAAGKAALRVNAPDPSQDMVIKRLLKNPKNQASSYVVTGAWHYENDGGCVGDVFKAIRALGLNTTISEMALSDTDGDGRKDDDKTYEDSKETSTKAASGDSDQPDWLRNLSSKESGVKVVYTRNVYGEWFAITLDRTLNPTCITLFKDGKAIGHMYTDETTKKGQPYMKIRGVEIPRDVRGMGFGKEMYKALLEHTNTAGIASHLPDRSNKQQIPAIYRSLGGYADGDWAYIPKKATAKTAMKITVPESEFDHFWQEPPPGHHEFWAFRWPVRAKVGDTINFTMNKKVVATAVISRIEKPGESECEQTGRFKSMWKVYWNPESFRDVRQQKTASPTTYSAFQEAAEDARNKVFGAGPAKNGDCEPTSDALYDILKAQGLNPSIAYGFYRNVHHSWVQVGDTYIDPTHDQFGSPDIREGKITDRAFKRDYTVSGLRAYAA